MSSLMKLESLTGGTPQEIIQIDTGNLTLGREAENSIVIDADAISRVHACVFEAMGNWFLRDLNSTNGTMINSVRIQPGQTRLLRNGDLIQLANFSMQFSLLNEDSSLVSEHGFAPPKLLVFYADHFETEFPLATPGSRFVIGGPEGHFFLDGAESDTPDLEICYNANHLEVSTGSGNVPVIVNGLSVGGVTALADRDEVDIGNYKIVVSDIASARTSKGTRSPQADAQNKPQLASPAINAHLGTVDPRDLDWDSEANRRKMMTGRKFIFGSAQDEDNVTGTIAMSRQDMARAVGVGEVSAAQRFAKTARRETPYNPEAVEKSQLIFGAFVLVFLIGAAVYFFAM